jgi:hypothetical protein
MMRLDWVAWSNPVAVWWVFLVAVSAVNLALLACLHWFFGKGRLASERWTFRLDFMIVLCAAYVFGCAFRATLPRADVQRICLFDTWLSSVLVGRSVATIAELCFAAQWAIVLRQLAKVTQSDWARNTANAVVPLILVAECCSWYAVITTSYLGNAVENSLWTLTFLLIAGAMLRVSIDFSGVVRGAIGLAIAGIVGYLAFMLTIDVPMYVERWQADQSTGKALLGFFTGLEDLGTRWAVTHNFAAWKDEIAWMSLYFSTAVWMSLALCGFGLLRHHLPRYRRTCGDLHAARTRTATAIAPFARRAAASRN